MPGSTSTCTSPGFGDTQHSQADARKRRHKHAAYNISVALSLSLNASCPSDTGDVLLFSPSMSVPRAAAHMAHRLLASRTFASRTLTLRSATHPSCVVGERTGACTASRAAWEGICNVSPAAAVHFPVGVHGGSSSLEESGSRGEKEEREKSEEKGKSISLLLLSMFSVEIRLRLQVLHRKDFDEIVLKFSLRRTHGPTTQVRWRQVARV